MEAPLTSPSSSASSRTLLASRPPELDVFLDFISDDDRPTFVLEQSSAPRIIYRNDALDALVTGTSQDVQFLNWVDTLTNVAGDGTAQDLRKIDNLGTFASRIWSSKRVGGAWTAVFCKQNVRVGHDDTSGNVEAQVEVRPPETQERHDTSTITQESPGYEWHEMEHASSSDSSTLLSRSTPGSDPKAGNTANYTSDSLEDLVVDWLAFPHLTPDPWIHFLINHDWDQTAVGPTRTWRPTLRQMYNLILSSTEPRVLYWGENLYMFYNAAARSLVGEMHPYPLGNALADVWGVPMLEQLTETLITGVKRGKPLHNKRRELVITRHGFPESCFFDFVFLPIPSRDGYFTGFINEFTEVTEAVLQENRQHVSRSLLENITKANDMQDLWTEVVRTLEEKSKDLSYALIYAHHRSDFSASDKKSMRLQAAFGIQGLRSEVPPALLAALQRSNNDVVELRQRKNTLPLEFAASVPDVGIVNTACALPIASLDGHNLSAILVLGMSPIRPISPSSRQFVDSLRNLIFKSSALFSLPLERRRAQEITIGLSQQLETMTIKAERNEQNFTRMVHDAPIGMCIVRKDGFPIYVNDIYLSLLGTSRAEYYKAAETGFAWRDSIFDDDLESVNQAWTTAVEGSEPSRVKFRVKSPSPLAALRWLEVTVHQRYDQDGNATFLYAWLTDVSSSKLTESLIEEKLTDALETKRSSENFIDMVSHEMRNPLSSILQLADNIALSLPPLTGDGQVGALTLDARHTLVDTAQTITLCAKHQKNIIDDVLTLSKLDSKLLVIALDRVKPSTIVESVLKMIKAELGYEDIQGCVVVQQSYKDLAIDHVLLDPGRISQVIINLVSNAIKFTKDSSMRRITISISASSTRPTNEDCQVTLIEARENMRNNSAQPSSTYKGPVGVDVFLCFSVQDTGCGLTEEEMGHLFHRFSQASPKTYKQYGGSGLGLFISRELVELQGGQIGVRSESGKGSTFAFYVKAARAEPSSDASNRLVTIDHASLPSSVGQTGTSNGLTRPERKPQDLHVLVVEDNAINQRVMAQQLRKVGCAKVHVADHGLDALTLLSTTAFFGPVESGKIPLSVVLLDVEMPVMDGLTCARKIRELEANAEILRHVPIIGITANARPDQINACIEAGMDEVLTKPFRIPELVPRMLALVDKHEPED